MRCRLMPGPFLGVSWGAAAAAASGGTGGCPAYGTCRAHPTAARTVAPTEGAAEVAGECLCRQELPRVALDTSRIGPEHCPWCSAGV